MQGGAGQGVHMPKPKFSIKTEVLGGGGVQWQWQWQRLRLTAPPPPLCFPVDAFLLTVLSGGLLAREVLYYALCGAISAAKRPSSCPQGACKYSSCPCPVRSAEGCRAVQGGAGQGVHMPKPGLLNFSAVAGGGAKVAGLGFEPPTTRIPVGCITTGPLLGLRQRASMLLGAASATDKKPKVCVSV